MKITEKIKSKFRKNEEESKMKNWSLKKKLLVGAGVLGTAAIGVIAYGRCKPEDEVDYNENFNNEDDEDYDSEEDLDEEEGSAVAEDTTE